MVPRSSARAHLDHREFEDSNRLTSTGTDDESYSSLLGFGLVDFHD